MENLKTINPKELKLHKIEKDINKITDGLGLEIDPEIKNTVKFLIAHDFSTYGSCEGHVDNGLPYPWIDIGNLLRNDVRFQELSKKITYIEENDSQIDTRTDTEKEEYEFKVNEVKEKNNIDKDKLESLLEEFNEKNESNIRLTLEKRGWNSVRLQPENSYSSNPDEIRNNISEVEIELKLQEYRNEINKFTEFLKNKFYKD